MKILFITDNFPPEVNAPASRTYEHAKRWLADGANVTVITYITSNEGFARRILDYVSFMCSAVFFGLFEKRPDVVVGTSPQFFAAVAAWLLSVAKWRPFVFELRDLWPASIVTVGAMKKGVVIRFLEMLEIFLYRRAAAIVSVTESFKKDLQGRGIDGNKIYVIRNGVDLSRYQPRARSEDMAATLGVADRFVVAYLGTHGMAHALENVLSAAKQLENEPDICFLLVGYGAQKQRLLQRAGELQLGNVVFHDSMPKDKMPELWSVCDVALVHLKDDPVFATVIPSKIFEAFGMGRPVMIVQPKGEAAELVQTAGAGEWIAPEDPAALAQAVLAWKNDPAKVLSYEKKAADAAQQHSRDRLAREMLEILSRLSTA
jgi:glycosyltransferase involved in cell wall biosynthesis